jgi:hypothetical protein
MAVTDAPVAPAAGAQVAPRVVRDDLIVLIAPSGLTVRTARVATAVRAAMMATGTMHAALVRAGVPRAMWKSKKIQANVLPSVWHVSASLRAAKRKR